MGIRFEQLSMAPSSAEPLSFAQPFTSGANISVSCGIIKLIRRTAQLNGASSTVLQFRQRFRCLHGPKFLIKLHCFLEPTVFDFFRFASRRFCPGIFAALGM